MSSTDHLARAKDYIARGEDFYRRAADEIAAARAAGTSWSAVEREIGRSRKWAQTLVAWATECADPHSSPFGGEEENTARYERQARTVLKDPERRQRAMADLSTEQVVEVAREAAEVAVQRSRAQRSEHSTEREPTIGELLDGEQFDPSEKWADRFITGAWDRAHALRRQVEKHGLWLGSMDDDKAFELVEQAERDIAEVRVALQERVRDHRRVGAAS